MTNAFDNWVASLGGSVTTEARGFLRSMFDNHGPISADRARHLCRDHQLALARTAVELVARDIAVTTNVDPPRFEYRDEDGSIRLAFRGQYATTPIFGLTQPEVTVEVADFMQDEVVEDLWGVWPECPDHRNGLYPVLSSDRAAWVCRAGAHAVADIGHLAPPSG